MSGAVKKPRTKPVVSDLDPGDTISVGISGEITVGRGQKMWPRFGVEAKVREGETAEEATDRASEFVMEQFSLFVQSLK